MKLLDYLPPVLGEIKEYRMMAKALEPELAAAGAALEEARGDFFLAGLSAEGAARWEGVFGIAGGAKKSLDERRARLQVLYLGRLPYTLPALRAYLRSIDPGLALAVDEATCTAWLVTTPATSGQRMELADALRQMCPANLRLGLGLKTPAELKAGAALGHIYSHVKAERGSSNG